MKGQKSEFKQGLLFQDGLLDNLNPKNALLVLAKKIPWDILENELSSFYSNVGRPAKPVRLMCGLMILKSMYNFSDDRVIEVWIQNPYFQAFCGEVKFQWEAPCASSDLTHFRNRLGEEGFEKIFKVSILIHGDQVLEKEVLIDTTVQEKNITFPTDSKLCIKIIAWCWKAASQYGYRMRRSFKKEVKELIKIINFCRSPKKFTSVIKSRKRLKTIAGKLFREMKNQLPFEILLENHDRFEIFNRVLTQKKNDKNKIYSLHEPKTLCIAKGKQHKKYEFGSKVCLVVSKTSGIIVGAKNFDTNVYDGDSVEDIVKQMVRILNYKPELMIADKGFRGRKIVEGVKVITPANQSCKISETEKNENKKRFKRRSAIEPVIGHLKSDFRMARNFLKGTPGDCINVLMAAAAFNFNKWMRSALLYFYFVIRYFYFAIWYSGRVISQKMPDGN